jgi:anti-anti-sigma factor
MDYQIQSTSSGVTVHLSGRLTFTENTQFRGMLMRLQEHAANAVTLDLGEVEFIDSAGLGMLLYTRDALHQRQGVVSLSAASGQVGRMLDLSRIRDLFGG